MRAGTVAEGPRHPLIVEAVERARHLPPRFASLRNKVPAADVSLEAYPFVPYALHEAPPPRSSRVEPTPLLAARLAAGPISLAESYGAAWPRVERWWAEAAPAMIAVASGRPYTRPPDVTVLPEELPDYMREAVEAGIVLDFFDHAEGRIVQPSSGDTEFPGRRVDSDAYRRQAEQLGWAEYDVVQHVASGGVEMRSKRVPATVLSFHHRGLAENFPAAKEVVSKEIAERWTQPLRAGMRYNPSVYNPRNVVVQMRQKIESDGSVVEYAKPRVTTDLSWGDDSTAINANMPEGYTTLAVPTVQQGARGAAVTASLFGGEDVRHRELARTTIRVTATAQRYRPRVRRDGRRLLVPIDSTTLFGNPFRMGVSDTEEALRDAVCEAYARVLEDVVNAHLPRIADSCCIPPDCVDERWLDASHRATVARAIVDLIDKVREGSCDLDLQCCERCRGKRCHGHALARFIERHTLYVSVSGGIVDLESAYSFVPAQRCEWNLQVFLWAEERADGEWLVGTCVAERLTFGGGHGPHCFDIVGNVPLELARRDIAAFDAAHPPRCPTLARKLRGWQQRRAAQAELASDPAQLGVSMTKKYLDDVSATALDDRVPSPARLSHIWFNRDTTIALGGVPPHPQSRILVHLRFIVHRFKQAGFSVPPLKMQCADRVVDLGFLVRYPRGGACDGRIRCTAQKRVALRIAALTFSTHVERHSFFERRAAERFVHRLGNLAQIEPALVPLLRGGYAMANARKQGRAGTRGPLMRTVRVNHMSRAGRAFEELCSAARAILAADEGVPLAPALVFAGTQEAGVSTAATDASGDVASGAPCDAGIGGMLYRADRPREVWLLSEPWPADVAAALRHTATARREKPEWKTAMAGLAMPVAEAFAMWALPTAAALDGLPTHAVIAIGDCMPAVCAFNRATSGVEQMRIVVAAARGDFQQWLGVHVHRELNVDPDRLSHPSGAADVIADAEAAGLVVHRVWTPAHCWAALRKALATPPGRLAVAEDDSPDDT